ncbi:unnamed protein product [Chrysodeixis includens]|uniref:Serpin domain-containing protein n=1 Tax=Chrysodeixis includens TaxID=689277 RepID=A0A9P0FTN0_CHRIL|nr:unnamed protein product [Chrysodeixis includens]
MRAVAAIVLIFASCQSLDCQNRKPKSRLSFFDIDLLRYAAEDRKGNVMISPASIKSTLAMLLEGAEGTTASEIKTALRLSPVKTDFREELGMYLTALQANGPTATIENACGLFVDKKLKLKRDYEMVLRGMYKSEVNQVDFKQPKATAEAINNWVNTKTKGLIPTIVDDGNISPSAEVFVTNTLYFKSSWLHEFNPSLTHGDCFYKDGVCKIVAMMDLQTELNYAYIEDLRAHALELPYQGGRYSMILLVPQDRDAGMALIRDLPYIGLLEISKLMEPNDVILTMPKFDVEYSDDMIGTLKNMRISSLFSPSANLSGIIEGTSSAYINSFFHTVHMSVDEKGTIAAAATAAMIVPLIDDHVQLRIDRPFLFFIRDNELGLVLFEGKIEEPSEFKVATSGPVGTKTDQTPVKTPQNPIMTIPKAPSVIQKPLEPWDALRPIISQPADTPPIWNRAPFASLSSTPSSPSTTSPATSTPSSTSLSSSPSSVSTSFSSPSTSSSTPSPSPSSQSTTEASIEITTEKGKSGWRKWFPRYFDKYI